MNVTERKVGEVFDYEDKGCTVRLRVLKCNAHSSPCAGCFFRDKDCSPRDFSQLGFCARNFRQDGEDVFFAKIRHVTRAVGSTFKYNGTTYKVVEDSVRSRCTTCALYDKCRAIDSIEYGDEEFRSLSGDCAAMDRSDGIGVHFEKAEGGTMKENKRTDTQQPTTKRISNIVDFIGKSVWVIKQQSNGYYSHNGPYTLNRIKADETQAEADLSCYFGCAKTTVALDFVFSTEEEAIDAAVKRNHDKAKDDKKESLLKKLFDKQAELSTIQKRLDADTEKKDILLKEIEELRQELIPYFED